MKGTILLIDDDKFMHQYIQKALSKADYKILSAYTGQQGLEIMRQNSPDVVLLDYLMPDMDGYQVYNRIVNNEIFSSIPIVILTAIDERSEIKDELLKKGLSAYLEKPFGHRELINVIENIIVTNRIRIKNEQLHRAIRDTKDFLENLINSSPDAIITINLKGEITSFSPASEDMFGFSAKEILGKSFASLLKDSSRFNESWRQLNNNEFIRNFETDFLSTDDTYIPVNFSMSSLQDKNNDTIGVLAIGKDLSEIKDLERKLIEKEKLTILMETTVAINHEINNPLTPILGNLQLILDKKDELHMPIWLIDKLHIIEKNAWRIQKIVQKLNDITKPVSKHYCGETHMLDIESS